jgi:ribose/xylose/arabinose/galactoside ABC-type transport system permease subunit
VTNLNLTARRSFDAAATWLARFRSRHASWIPVFAAIVILLLMWGGAEAYFNYTGTLAKGFLSPRLISSLLLNNAYLLILAVGMTFVILTGGIDLSVGSVLAFTGILCASMLADGVPASVAVPAMIIAGAAIGLLIGVLVHYFEVQPFIASLVGMFLARGLTFLISLDAINVKEESITSLQSTRFTAGDWFITPTGIIALLVVLAGVLILQFTRFGRTIYAIGGNEQSARLMGLPVVRTKILAYVISGVCSGLAGLVLVAFQGMVYPLNGTGAELDTIAAVVIGGTLLTGGSGYVIGSFIGVLVYGTISVTINFLGAEQSWKRIIVGSFLLAFVVVQRLIVMRSARRS